MIRGRDLPEFPPVPDDQVFCSIRGELVGVSVCASDACVAPEARPVCWEGNGSRYQCTRCGAWNSVSRDRCGNCRKVLK